MMTYDENIKKIFINHVIPEEELTRVKAKVSTMWLAALKIILDNLKGKTQQCAEILLNNLRNTNLRYIKIRNIEKIQQKKTILKISNNNKLRGN